MWQAYCGELINIKWTNGDHSDYMTNAIMGKLNSRNVVKQKEKIQSYIMELIKQKCNSLFARRPVNAHATIIKSEVPNKNGFDDNEQSFRMDN